MGCTDLREVLARRLCTIPSPPHAFGRASVDESQLNSSAVTDHAVPPAFCTRACQRRRGEEALRSLICSAARGAYEADLCDDSVIRPTIFGVVPIIHSVLQSQRLSLYCAEILHYLGTSNRSHSELRTPPQPGHDRELGVYHRLATAAWILETMTSLKAQLKAERRKTAHGFWFVPEGSLQKILTKDAVLRRISECRIPLEIQEEIVNHVLDDARILFAILVRIEQEHLIAEFISHELRDDKLAIIGPDSVEGLEVDPRFFEKRWEFLAPIFRRRNVLLKLKDEYVLPFLEDRRLDGSEGGYANAFRVTLDARHQGLVQVQPHNKEVVVFRKELKVDDDDELIAKEFQDEDKILKMLNTLHSKSIVLLYISYKHKGVYNFLFPMADMDLEHLLTAKLKPTPFQDDIAIIRALFSLGNAIAGVHDFYSEQLGVELKGCHHDLKPRNILVSEGTFVLADFGLSRFKEPETNSKSISKTIGDYLAPECRESTMKRMFVGRKSDIWSFGCIVMEVLAFMDGGAQAVAAFREERVTESNGWKTHSFQSNGRLKVCVQTWLDTKATDSNHAKLVDLINRMVSDNPNNRPNANTVQNIFRGIYFNRLLDSSLKLCSNLVTRHRNPHFLFASAQLKSWGYAVGIFQPQHSWSWRICQVNLLTDPALEILEGLHCKLQRLFEGDQSTTNGNAKAKKTYSVDTDVEERVDLDSRELRDTVEKLLGLVPREVKAASELFLLQNLLSTNDPDTLRHIQSAANEHGNLVTVGAMPELKQTVQQFQDEGALGELANTLPAGSKIIERRAFGSHTIGDYSISTDPAESVLIEWRPYDSAAYRPTAELLRRVDASVNIMNVKRKPSGVRVLGCIGYYEEPQRRSFGVVYRLSPPNSSKALTFLEPTSLFDLITSTLNTDRGKPYLGERFEVARSVATCTFYFHSCNWLHKSLNSHNVIFLVPKGSTVSRNVRSPYIIGFNHTREDKDDEYSHGPPSDAGLIPYLHPDYITTKRFRKVFDYYSVGLLLLELGIWRTARSMSDAHPLHNHEALRKEFVTRYLPELPYIMGEVYYRATKACLTEELGTVETPEEDVVNAFQTLVIARLQSCTV